MKLAKRPILDPPYKLYVRRPNVRWTIRAQCIAFTGPVYKIPIGVHTFEDSKKPIANGDNSSKKRDTKIKYKSC